MDRKTAVKIPFPEEHFMNSARDPSPHFGEDGAFWHRATHWMLTGSGTRSAEIEAQLLLRGLLNGTTLLMVTLSMSLVAIVAIGITGGAWAYAWLAAELMIGCARLSLQKAVEQDVAAGRSPETRGPMLASLVAGIVLGIAGYQCVASGDPVLILLSGICLGGLVGGTSVRSASTPRFTIVLMCLMALPYSFATLLSPIPNLYLIGLQMPLFLGGLFVVLRRDYKTLLSLYVAQRENRWLAHHDMLTGLPNRTMELKCFDDLLQPRVGGAVAVEPLFTVFCLDLDGFKDVNDQYGHAAGDTVLVVVADRLRRCIRDIDFLFRVGGDEFVILLPSISPDAAAAVADRIIERIAKPFDVGDDVTLRIGISVGSASATADGGTADELLRSADRAMYEAKRRGKGIYVPAVSGVVELGSAGPENSALPLPPAGFPLPLAGKSV